MAVTDEDRDRAHGLLFPGSFADRVELIAAALAAEREKARAPFLALVAFYDRHEYSTLNVDDLRELLVEP